MTLGNAFAVVSSGKVITEALFDGTLQKSFSKPQPARWKNGKGLTQKQNLQLLSYQTESYLGLFCPLPNPHNKSMEAAHRSSDYVYHRARQ